MRYCALVLTLIAVGYLATACHQHAAPTTTSQPLDQPTILKPVPAILIEDTLPSVAATEIRVKGKAGDLFEFNQAQFIDANHGWVMGNYSLYRTTDGGNNW